jgi:hypothetical protein
MASYFVTFTILVSVITVLICMVGIISLNSQLQSMWDELDFEMNQFKIRVYLLF